ncbi:hypothetical protein ABZ387_32825 [Streptomyces flaveolus]|uniref:hypothetical protein n=1 Tax=Streptomyces flaveolus TaxID=67297 RepID=UPI0033FEAA29
MVADVHTHGRHSLGEKYGPAAGLSRPARVGDAGPENIPSGTPEQTAPLYWELREARDRAEAVFTG